MPNPIAAIYLDNGMIIRIELLPQAAPNTVNSFLYATRHKIFDDHAIERIVPEDWIDVSYTGFGKPEGQYQIPNEFRLHPEVEPLPSDFGCVCMGGDGDRCLSGCEFFFPLRPCPEHRGLYPVFGQVIEGAEELLRLKSLELEPVHLDEFPEVKINRPVVPQKIVKVETELFGQEYPDPIFFQPEDPQNESCE